MKMYKVRDVQKLLSGVELVNDIFSPSINFFFGMHGTGKSTNAKQIVEYVEKHFPQFHVVVNELSFDYNKRNIFGDSYFSSKWIVDFLNYTNKDKVCNNILQNVLYVLGSYETFYSLGVSLLYDFIMKEDSNDVIVFTRSYDYICYLLARIIFLIRKNRIGYNLNVRKIIREMFYKSPITRYIYDCSYNKRINFIIKTTDQNYALTNEIIERLMNSFSALEDMEDVIEYHNICNSLFRMLSKMIYRHFMFCLDVFVNVFDGYDFDPSWVVGKKLEREDVG